MKQYLLRMAESKKHILMQALHDGRLYKIAEGGTGVGFYLLVFEGGECTHDYLQDSFDDARDFAREEFGVPLDAWKAESENPC